jgi:ABC-2 type transport system ATP-binding protein
VIETLVAKGTSVLLTTQYLEEADRLADRIIVIDKGLVAAEGTPAQLKATLGETTVSLHLASPAMAASAANELAGVGAAVSTIDSTLISFPLRSGPAMIREALNRLDAANIPVIRLDLQEPTLDDVFLNLTGATA